jgi:hypothetical protein
MTGLPRVLLALTPLVEREVEGELFGATPAVEIAASAAEADELEELIRMHGAADAVLVSSELSGLTGGHLAAASAAGLRVIGLALDEVGRDSLQSLGADDVLTLPLDADALTGAARGPAPAAPPARDRVPRRASKPGRSGGSVVAVIGSKGAPGASECAASLAALAASRWDAALVEVDALAPSLDVRLGADAEDGSVAALARAVQADAADVGDLLRRWTVHREGWPPVVLGAPEPLRDLARPGSAARAVRALASAHPVVFCDLGFLITIEDPDGASTIARIHRETLATADAIVLVLGARDVQLRHGLAQLEALVVGLEVASERLRLVVNGVGGPGAGSRLEIETALNPHLQEHGLVVDSWLPWDARAVSVARRRGVPLAVARTRGAYRRALDHLLDELFLPIAPMTRTRKQRLPAGGARTVTTAAPANAEEVAVPWRH